MRNRNNLIFIHGPIEQVWADCVDKFVQAQRTGNLDDYRAAGQAWSRWLDLYVTDETRRRLDALDNPTSPRLR
jgi:hypothetical protein